MARGAVRSCWLRMYYLQRHMPRTKGLSCCSQAMAAHTGIGSRLPAAAWPTAAAAAAAAAAA